MNFRKSTKNTPEEQFVDTGSSMTVLGHGTKVTGKIKANSDIRVDGEIKGEIFCDKKVVIGEKGKLEVNLETQEVSIEGGFKGNVKASKQIKIGPRGVLTGDLNTPSLIIEEGAIINSQITMKGGVRD